MPHPVRAIVLAAIALVSAGCGSAQVRRAPAEPNAPSFQEVATRPLIAFDPTGASMAGSVMPESRVSFEGLDIANPGTGAVEPLPREFVSTVELEPSGYAVDHGGASGGQQIMTRRDDHYLLRGDAGVRVSPRLVRPRIVWPDDGALRAREVDDLGGQLYASLRIPLQRDRVHLVLGVVGSLRRSTLTQDFRARVGDEMQTFASQRFRTGATDIQYLAGLDIMSRDHQLAITTTGGPSFIRTSYRLPLDPEPNAFGQNPHVDRFGGSSRNASGIVNDTFGTTLRMRSLTTLKYRGWWLDGDLPVEANVGYAQFLRHDAWRLDHPELRERPAIQHSGLGLQALLDQDEAGDLVPGVGQVCNDASQGEPCPVDTWVSGGIGETDRDISRRVSSALAFTLFRDIRIGASFDWLQRHGIYRHSGGRVVIDDQEIDAPTTDTKVASRNYALFGRYRLRVSRNLIIDAGLRWELQDMRDAAGESALLIWDSLAPRIGAAWDWTGRGRSRAYAEYGRYYQPLPLQLASRAFAEPDEDPSRFVVQPRLQAPYNRQLQLGYDHEVVDDLILGGRWQHHALGRAVEDVALDGGAGFMIANPGEKVRARALDEQRERCSNLADDLDALGRCEQILAAYEGIATRYRKPTRIYDGLTIQALERFAHDWYLLASYTFSRQVGDYDGFVDPIRAGRVLGGIEALGVDQVEGPINLGASPQYDSPELVRNSYGRLARDVPHRLQLEAFHSLDFESSGWLSLSASVRVNAGLPISVRAPVVDPDAREGSLVYLLPRGAGGRVAPNYQVNLAAFYSYPLPRDFDLMVGVKVFNVTNAGATLLVDERYSDDAAHPIPDGDPRDLAHAKQADGGFYGRELVRPRNDFGAPTQLQQPISATFELNLSF